MSLMFVNHSGQWLFGTCLSAGIRWCWLWLWLYSFGEVWFSHFRFATLQEICDNYTCNPRWRVGQKYAQCSWFMNSLWVSFRSLCLCAVPPNQYELWMFFGTKWSELYYESCSIYSIFVFISPTNNQIVVNDCKKHIWYLNENQTWVPASNKMLISSRVHTVGLLLTAFQKSIFEHESYCIIWLYCVFLMDVLSDM